MTTERQTHFTREDVARMAGVAPRTVSQWLNRGRIKGTQNAIARTELERFFKLAGIPLGKIDQ